MSKLFPISIEVEQDAVGRVMLLLNKTPGVAKFHLDMDRVQKPNGADKPNGGERGPYKARKQPVTLEETGDQAVMKTLFTKSPMSVPQLREMFVAQGRSPKSISSVLHKLKQDGEVLIGDDGYILTKKARDRMRHKVSRKQTVMYVHKYEREDRLWCVGYWTTATMVTGMSVATFHTLRDCGSQDEAAAFINYLNGGDGREFEPTDKSP